MLNNNKNKEIQKAEQTLLLKLEEGRKSGEQYGYISSEDIHTYFISKKL